MTTMASEEPNQAGEGWVELTDIDLPGGTQWMGISDTAVIFQSNVSIHAYLLDQGRLIEIPSPTGSPADFAVRDDLLVWYEAYLSGDSFVNSGMYSLKLPDGPVVELIGPDREVAYPRLTDSAVAWTEPRETDMEGGMVVEQPIYYMELSADGGPVGEPRVLVSWPLQFIGGDALWSYDLSERYLAWEQHVSGESAGPGLYALDLDSGQETFVGSERWQPSLSGSMLAFSGGYGQNLTLHDLDTGDERVLDPEGYAPSLQSWFVAYVVGPLEDDTWQVAVSDLDGQSRQFLGEHPMPIQGSTIVTSERHVAFIDPNGTPRVFEWREPAGG